MYVIKTNDLHQIINNGVNYKTHGTLHTQLFCPTCYWAKKQKGAFMCHGWDWTLKPINRLNCSELNLLINSVISTLLISGPLVFTPLLRSRSLISIVSNGTRKQLWITTTLPAADCLTSVTHSSSSSSLKRWGLSVLDCDWSVTGILITHWLI